MMSLKTLLFYFCMTIVFHGVMSQEKCLEKGKSNSRKSAQSAHRLNSLPVDRSDRRFGIDFCIQWILKTYNVQNSLYVVNIAFDEHLADKSPEIVN